MKPAHWHTASMLACGASLVKLSYMEIFSSPYSLWNDDDTVAVTQFRSRSATVFSAKFTVTVFTKCYVGRHPVFLKRTYFLSIYIYTYTYVYIYNMCIYRKRSVQPLTFGFSLTYKATIFAFYFEGSESRAVFNHCLSEISSCLVPIFCK